MSSPQRQKLQAKLEEIISALLSYDKHQYFHAPVTPDIAPDYHTIIKTPMDFGTMGQKLSDFQYETLQDFQVCSFSHHFYIYILSNIISMI